MKNSKVLVVLIGFVLCAFSIVQAEDEPWFDLVNCEMCKPLGENPDLLRKVSWEMFELSNGILMLSTIDKGFEKQYKELDVAMQKVVDRIMAGEEVRLCNSCQGMNRIYMKQPKVENFVTKRGDVTVMTSDNPEDVAEMHEWIRRTVKELAKYEAEDPEEAQKHHGHEH